MPMIETSVGKEWHNHTGQRHRIDGPAYITHLGSEHWYLNDKRHRADGPASIYYENHLPPEWYRHGINITDEVGIWLTDENISWPMTDEQRVLFTLRFG
jgi:hypothetical protein